jgi:DNA-binding IclR family transcriptional regulator
VKLVTRALSLLDVLAGSPTGLPLTEIACEAALPASTAHRLLQSLAQLGYVAKSPLTAQYTLGEKLILLGHQAERQRDVRQIARPWLEKLAQETRETVNLTTLFDESVVQLDCVESPNILKATWDPGQRFPVYASASGKVFLAYLSTAERQRILESVERRAYTDRTIVDAERLRLELESIKKNGYGVDDAEREKGVRCGAYLQRQGSARRGSQHQWAFAASVTSPAA